MQNIKETIQDIRQAPPRLQIAYNDFIERRPEINGSVRGYDISRFWEDLFVETADAVYGLRVHSKQIGYVVRTLGKDGTLLGSSQAVGWQELGFKLPAMRAV